MTTEAAPESSSLRAERSSDDVVRLKGPWLVLAHLAWVSVLVLCLVLAVVGIFVRSHVDAHPCESSFARDSWLACKAWQAASIEMGISLGFTGAFFLVLRVVATLPYFALAVILVARRPAELRLLLLSVLLAVVGATGTWFVPLFDWARFAYPSLYLPGQLVDALIFCGLLFGYLFPDGRFVPRWTRWPALLIVPLAFAAGFFKGTALDFRMWPFPLPQAINLTLLGSSVYAVVYRYRHVAGSVQRQQIKWIVSGFSLLFVLWFLDYAVNDLYPTATGNDFPFPTMRYDVARHHLNQLAWYVAQLLFAIAVGVAVFRYRLYDIDVIIRRTLIYGALTATLALVYLVSVVVLQQFLTPLFGARSDVAVVASTLLTAAISQRLRRRIQASIDRRFFRRKYNAVRILAAFSANLRDEVEMGRVTTDLLEVVEETLQPAHVTLWLRQPKRR